MSEYRIKLYDQKLYFTGIEDNMAVNVTTNKDIALVFDHDQANDIVNLLNMNTDYIWEPEWVEN